jgi:hypothetical protein
VSAKRRYIFGGSTFVAICIAAWLFATRSRPVVFRFKELGSVNAEPALIVANPFRDKQPEAAAIVVLEALRRKDFDHAFSTIPMEADQKRSIVERESKYPLRGWALRDRTDGPETVRLYYVTTRSNSHGVKAPMWLTVRRSQVGWTAEKVEAWY